MSLERWKIQWLDPGFNTHVEAFYKKLQRHMRFEETVVFPFIERRLDADHTEALTDVMAEVKKLAPTRPHPKAPTGVLATFAPLIRLLDRIRDFGKKYPQDMVDDRKDTPFE